MSGWRAAFLLAVLAALASRAPGQAAIAVEPPVQVSSANSHLLHDEVIVTADPSHPNRLLACSIVHRMAGTRTVTNVAYRSDDGGRSWTQAFVFKDGPEAFDPTCAYGPDGEVYFAGLETVSVEPYKTSVLLYRSDDGGQHWTEKTEVGEAGGNDRPFITVASDGPQRGAVYVVETAQVITSGKSSRALVVYRSADRGKTFVKLSSAISSVPSVPGGIVRPDGTLALTVRKDSSGEAELYRRVRENTTLQPDGKIMFLEAGASGAHIENIADAYGCSFERNGSVETSFAGDTGSGAFHGRLYVSWPDSRSGRCEILFSYSADQGKTWSAPFAVNDDGPRVEGPGPDDARPAVAVSPSGVVGVMWYDRRDSEDDRGWTARFAASMDGGETFLPSVALSPGQTQFLRGAVVSLTGLSFGGGSELASGENLSALLGYQREHGLDGGDTSGLAAGADGVFHPVWADNSSGIFQVWTAAARVSGDVVKNGAAGLADLGDISGRVTVIFDNVELDKERRLITADLSILNTSGQVLTGPFKLRVLRAVSPAGLLKIRNADGSDGYSAMLDFTSLVPNGRLQPGQQSSPRHIEIPVPGSGALDRVFAIDRLLLSGDGSYRTGFVRLDLKCLGGKGTGSRE